MTCTASPHQLGAPGRPQPESPLPLLWLVLQVPAQTRSGYVCCLLMYPWRRWFVCGFFWTHFGGCDLVHEDEPRGIARNLVLGPLRFVDPSDKRGPGSSSRSDLKQGLLLMWMVVSSFCQCHVLRPDNNIISSFIRNAPINVTITDELTTWSNQLCPLEWPFEWLINNSTQAVFTWTVPWYPAIQTF